MSTFIGTAMTNVTYLPPPRSTTSASAAAHHARATGESAFWTSAIGIGVNVIASQITDIDTLSERIQTLAPHATGRRPAVGQYLDMVRQLASAWPMRGRPALLMALAALHYYADSLTLHDAPLLAGAFDELGGGRRGAACAAGRLIASLTRRLDYPVRSLDAVNDHFGSYLAQMASASNDLETDTMLVTQRLQADHVHAYMLMQQVHQLQDSVSGARARQHGHWPLGAHAERLREQIATHTAALDSARRQLEQIRAAQSVTMNEAAALQSLLPALSAYLAGVDRMSAGISAALTGALSLQVQLGELNNTMLAAPLSAASAQAQLGAAVPHWRNVAARLQRAGELAHPAGVHHG